MQQDKKAPANRGERASRKEFFQQVGSSLTTDKGMVDVQQSFGAALAIQLLNALIVQQQLALGVAGQSAGWVAMLDKRRID